MVWLSETVSLNWVWRRNTHLPWQVTVRSTTFRSTSDSSILITALSTCTIFKLKNVHTFQCYSNLMCGNIYKTQENLILDCIGPLNPFYCMSSRGHPQMSTNFTEIFLSPSVYTHCVETEDNCAYLSKSLCTEDLHLSRLDTFSYSMMDIVWSDFWALEYNHRNDI